MAYRKKSDGVGEVKRLFLKKEYRGRGISKLLLSTVENHARAQGLSKLFLDTRITLEPAVSLYKKSGFKIIFKQGLYVQLEKEL
ncbi:MAG: GNAT family N-acetyltransferase [Lachnospiraceae bacterium]|nr:GNAT family N-acetyltransferase [Lachnospiraceae bacterium]